MVTSRWLLARKRDCTIRTKTSYLYQVLNAFLPIPSSGVTAVKDFSFRVKTKPKQKPNLHHPCLKQPKCGIQGWGRAGPLADGTHHTTPTQERNQGHQKVSCELQATGQPTVRADRPAHRSRAQAGQPATPLAEGE